MNNLTFAILACLAVCITCSEDSPLGYIWSDGTLHSHADTKDTNKFYFRSADNSINKTPKSPSDTKVWLMKEDGVTKVVDYDPSEGCCAFGALNYGR